MTGFTDQAVVPPVALRDVRAALGEAVPRLSALVRGVGDPGARAMGTWNVAELATHLAHVFEVIPDLATAESPSSPLGEFEELGQFTRGLVENEPERDVIQLADRIDDGFRQFMEATASVTGDERRPWLVDGLETSLRTLHCHILNEVLVHGHDVARASRQAWSVRPDHAALVLQGFIVPVIGLLGQRVVNEAAAAGLNACYDVRLRGAGGRVFFNFDDGVLSATGPSPRRVDCHISADPAELLLVVWNRKSQWGPIARFQMTAWGRRPWLAFRLVNLLTSP